MSYREIWKVKKKLYETQVKDNIKLIVDDYNFYLNRLDEKNDNKILISNHLSLQSLQCKAS